MTSGRRAFRFVWAGASRAAAWPFRVAAARAALRTLAGMDRRELADIGLSPSDVRDASALPLDRNPTDFLARRAYARRRDAFGPGPSSNDWRRPLDGRDDQPKPKPPPARSEPKRTRRAGGFVKTG